MALSRDEMLADLRKARINKYIYLGASIGLALLAAALVVTFFVRVPRHDVAAMLLAAVGIFFSALMAHQSVKTRRIENTIASRLAATPEGGRDGAQDERGEQDEQGEQEQQGEQDERGGGEVAPDHGGPPPANGGRGGQDEP